MTSPLANTASSEMVAQDTSILLGDIGATNARFANLTGDLLGTVQTFEVGRFSSFEDLLKHALDDQFSNYAFSSGLLALAGPIDRRRCRLTNTSWLVDAQALEAKFGFAVQLINDFQAVAHSLTALTTRDLKEVGNGKPDKSAPKVVLGPGSGLGVACLLGIEGQQIVVSSEGGHATLAGGSDREDAVLRTLRKRYGHASAERAISGPGLENIYDAICRIDGEEPVHIEAAEITHRALLGECPRACEALSMFCSLLGSFAGNVALTFGARGGVYIAGGISPRIVEMIARSDFRSRFEAKGRFRKYVEAIPSYIVVHPAAAFLGLQAFLSET